MIDGVDFHNLECQKYWSFPSSYSIERKKTETRNMIFSGEYIGSRKMDGALYKFIKNDDGSMELIGRSKGVSGDYLNKLDWVPQLHKFFELLPNGTCLLGEIYFPNNEGSKNTTTIMGCLAPKARARQEKGDKLHYYIFDILAYGGKSIYEQAIEQRITYLYDLVDIKKANYPDCIYIDLAEYYSGKDLWNQLQSILSNGGEGVVITKIGSCYQPGKRKARQSLKIKKELHETIDCFFTGCAMPPAKEYTGKEVEIWKYWINERTGEKIQGAYYKDFITGAPYTPITKSYFNGWAGSLEIGVVKGDKVVPIGFLSSLTEEIKANYKDYKGKVIEITAMEILRDNGKFSGLRHAKMLNFRPDLSIEDCTWEKVENS